MSQKTVSVPDISCGHCVRTIESELAELPGVRRVRADVATKRVAIEWEEAQTPWAAIRDRLREIGYPAEDSGKDGA
jgi:copper chaperone CopZ